MKTLYIEAVLCQATGAAGWGIEAVAQGRHWGLGGVLHFPCDKSQTIAELAAVDAALTSGCNRLPLGWEGSEVILAMRSTAALSVLRWVFPEAPCDGHLPVPMPKRISPATRGCRAVYDLSDAAERLHLRISLRHAQEGMLTRSAQSYARSYLEVARGERRAVVDA